MHVALILAIIGGVLMRLTAVIGKLSLDVSKTTKATVKTEHRINNLDSPLSDRLDKIGTAAMDALEAVNEVAKTLKTNGQKLEKHSKDLRGSDESAGILRSVNRDVKKGLAHTPRK